MRCRTMLCTALVLSVGGFAVCAAAKEPAPKEPAHKPDAPAASAQEVPEPLSISAAHGALGVTLTAKLAQVTVAGRTFVSNVYNGLYIPPVLRLRRGDALRLRLVNSIGRAEMEIDKPEVTNLHYHGMALPPVQPADDIYMLVPALDMKLGKHTAHPGVDLKDTNSFEYQWTVPDDHPMGVFWYHPHPHGLTEDQVLGGMSGMLVIEGLIETQYKELLGLRRRTLIFKDIELPGAKESDPKTKTINGILGGTLSTQPGAFEIWELGNLGADSYIDLALDGHSFFVLERDGNALVQPEKTGHVFLPPASRATVVVETGAAGRYTLRSRKVETGRLGDPNPEIVLATLHAGGAPVDGAAIRARLAQPAAAPDQIGPTAAQVAALPVTAKRRIVYTENADGTKFFINGKAFAADRIDVDVTLGDVEEWTIVNNSDERHTFHIHQTDFLVQSTGGSTLETAGMRDNVDIPYRDPKTRKPAEVKLKIPFTNPTIVGKFPFHCHILEHEDGGMMMNLRVSAP